jgi:hypothetical protein
MPSYDTMTLDEIDAAMAVLRARRKVLKSSGAGAQRKIVTLAHRRERLMQQVHALDAQIATLRGGSEPKPAVVGQTVVAHTRRRQSDVAASLEAIVACVQRHTTTQRATIVEECGLSPANASIYLRRLCQEGRLMRRGEKSATTYMLP